MFIANASLRRRLEREIDVIQGYYSVKVMIIPKKEMCIYVFDELNRFMKLYMDINYPFKPPQFMISDRTETHHELYYVMVQKLASFYQKKLNIKTHGSYCICCDNIVCDWSPGYHLIHLIREFKDMEKWFHDLRSGYFGMESLKQKKILFKDVITYIGSYIYRDAPNISRYIGNRD